MTKHYKLLSLAACMSAAFVASSAYAAEQKVDLPRDLDGYVAQDKAFWDYLKANHPYFKYLKEGRVVGKFTMSDRTEEWVNFGGGDKYAKDTGRKVAVTYRLPMESFLDLPNKFVGPKKCGECHPAQYERWERSRHNKIVRFPEELTEVGGDLKKPLYGSKASVLPEGVEADDVFVIMGTPRTKYGFVDKWLVRGTYHVEGGNLGKGTGKIVAGGNQFSRNWAQHLTPEVVKKINAWDPTFPTKLEDFGAQSSNVWGFNSYGASNRTQAMFQPGSSYCEICHTWKFDFKSQDELFAALGDSKKLRSHVVAKGVSCEECHGAGAHLYGARGAGMPSNCERCHQRRRRQEELQDAVQLLLQELLPGLRYRRFAVPLHEALSEGHALHDLPRPARSDGERLVEPVHGSEPQEGMLGLPHDGRVLLLAGRHPQPQQLHVLPHAEDGFLRKLRFDPASGHGRLRQRACVPHLAHSR